MVMEFHGGLFADYQRFHATPLHAPNPRRFLPSFFLGVVLPRISAVWHTRAAMGWAKRDQPSSAHAETIKPARLSPSPLRIPSVCPPDTRRSTANPD